MIANPYYQQILQSLTSRMYQPPQEQEQPVQLPQSPLMPLPQDPAAQGGPNTGQMQAMTKETAKKPQLGQASAPASGDMQQRMFGFQPNQFPTQSFGY